MNLDWIFFLENIIWFVIPIIFSWVASRIFKFVTKKKKTAWFVFLALFSVIFFCFFFRMRCACMEICQLICTAQVASFFNFIFFLFGLIVALILDRWMSKSPESR